MSSQAEPRIPLPKAWNKHVRSSVLHVISLAQFAAAFTRGWGSDSINPRLRKKTELMRLTATEPRVQSPANCVGEITSSQEDRTCWFQALGSGIRGSVWDDIVLSELFQNASLRTR